MVESIMTTTSTTTSLTTTTVMSEASGLENLPEPDRKHHNAPIPIDSGLGDYQIDQFTNIKSVVETTTTTPKLTTKTEELLYEDEFQNVRVEPVDKPSEELVEDDAFDYRNVITG